MLVNSRGGSKLLNMFVEGAIIVKALGEVTYSGNFIAAIPANPC